MSKIKTFTHDGFSDSLGFTECSQFDGTVASPRPWAIARLIRREVRRKGIVTRRDLRRVIEPFLAASRLDGDCGRTVHTVADRMVEVGELSDVKVENQRGYSAIPSRWIKLRENDAVLLGTVSIETDRFSPSHPNGFLRRFKPTDEMIANLDRVGVIEQGFDDWFGQPGWTLYEDLSQPVNSLDGLLEWYVSRLDTEGSPLRLDSTNILAVNRRSTEYFGSPRKPENSRWVSCDRLDEGIYVGAQLGRNDNHWVPLLIRIGNDSSRTLELHYRNNPALNNDLRNWLLIALGARYSQKEVISLDYEASELQCTFPIPHAMKRSLSLLCAPTGEWQRFAMLNMPTTVNLLSCHFPEVRFQGAAGDSREESERYPIC